MVGIIKDVAGVAGQSQAQGYPLETAGDGNITELPPAVDEDLCQDWDGPAGQSVLQGMIEPHTTGVVSGAYKAMYGSLCPAFAQTYTAASLRPLVMVRTAIGGTPLLQANATGNQNWSPTGVLYTQSKNRILAAMAAIDADDDVIGNVFIIWSQGYRDAVIGSDLDTYGDAMIELLGRYRTDLGVPDLQMYTELNYVPEAAYGNFDLITNIGTIIAQQQAAVAATEGLHIASVAGETFSTSTETVSSDELHDSQKGLNIIGEEFGNYVVNDVFSTTETLTLTSLIGRALWMGPAVEAGDPPVDPVVTFVRTHTGGQNKTSSTTLATALSATVAIDNTLILSFACDNLATTGPTVTGISKPGGEANSWVFLGRVAAASTTGANSQVTELWAIRTTMAWTTGDAPTVTINSARTAKAAVMMEFTETSTTQRGTVVTGVSLTGSPTGTHTSPVSGDLVAGASGFEQTAAITGDSDTTNGSWSAVHSIATTGGLPESNIRACLQYKIVTATGSQTYNPTGGSTDSSVIIAVLPPA